MVRWLDFFSKNLPIPKIIEIYCTISILENYLLFANTIYLRRMKRSFRLCLCHYLSFRPIWYFNITSSKVCNNVMLNTNHSMRHLWEMLYSIDSHSPHIHIPEMKTLTFLTWTYKRSKSFTSIITQSSKIHILCLAWITNNWWIRGTKVNNYILRIENC